MKNQKYRNGRTRRGRLAVLAVAALLLVGIMPAAAFADSTSIGKGQSNQDADTTLSYKVTPDYTVVIPKAVTLSSSSDTSLSITATKINAEPNYQVQVKVSEGLDNGKVTLARTNDTSYKIYADLKLGSATVTNTTAVAAFADNSTTPLTGTGTLTLGTPKDSSGSSDIKAGDYTGTVTFSVAYTSVNSSGN